LSGADSILLQRCIDGLRQCGFCESDYFGSPQSEKCIQVFHGVMLHNRIVCELREYIGKAGFGKVFRYQHEVQFASAPRKVVTPDNQNARPSHEREQPFNASGAVVW